jgi:hypothetical protein
VADKLLGEGAVTIPTVVMKELARDYSADDLKTTAAGSGKVARR